MVRSEGGEQRFQGGYMIDVVVVKCREERQYILNFGDRLFDFQPDVADATAEDEVRPGRTINSFECGLHFYTYVVVWAKLVLMKSSSWPTTYRRIGYFSNDQGFGSNIAAICRFADDIVVILLKHSNQMRSTTRSCLRRIGKSASRGNKACQES